MITVSYRSVASTCCKIVLYGCSFYIWKWENRNIVMLTIIFHNSILMCMYTIMYLCFWTGNMKNISCNRSPRWRFSEAQVLVQFSELDFLRNLPLFTELFKEWSHSKQKSGIAASFMALLCSANFVSALSNLSGGTYLINTLKIKLGNLNKLYFLSAIFF